MKLASRDKRVLAVGFLIALGIVAWSYVISPMQKRWRQAHAALEADREELGKLERVAGEREYYNEERERVVRMVHETPDLAAPQRVIPALINDVHGVGQERGLRITRYEPLPPKIEDTYATYSLSLASQSSLPELVAFLQDLQEHQPIIVVRRLHITPPGPNEEREDLSAEMLLSTYAVERLEEPEEDTETAKMGGMDAG